LKNVVRKLVGLKGVKSVHYRGHLLARHAIFVLNNTLEFIKLGQEQNQNRPQIAVVVVGRNDDYMTDFVHRLRISVSWNLRHFASEIVFVEWNPPLNRELLSLSLVKEFPSLRSYVVPREIHQRLCENGQIELLEYHAKNVGIRRAHSPWVLATNADAILALNGVQRILGTHLADDNVVWTTRRLDIHWREGRRRGVGLLDHLIYRRYHSYHPLGTGEFCLASRRLWERVRGYDESLTSHRFNCDRRGTQQMVAHGAQLLKAGAVLHMVHPTSCTELLQPHHGLPAAGEIPYHNRPNWGLSDRSEVQIAERVWRLE
jgi:hypothetical protein